MRSLRYLAGKNSFNIINFGCRSTQADGAAIEHAFLDRSFSKAVNWQASDVVVINTCTVTQSADAQARQMIRKVRRLNPGARIVVTGCYAQREPEKLARMPEVDCVVGNSHKNDLVNIVESMVGAPSMGDGHPGASSIHCADIFEQKNLSAICDTGGGDKTRPVLKIQDGCNLRCSYCIIPYVRGNSRSLPVSEVISQVGKLLNQGFLEIVLTGIHLGAFGKDLSPKTTLVELVQKLILLEKLQRLRVSSIEPLEVSKEIIHLVAASSKLARHFHIPLQSGSDRILQLMRRPYQSKQYSELVSYIRSRIPDAAIGADVMVGFPSESDTDFEETRQFLESLPLTYLHVFPYSPRPGTPAFQLKPKVTGPVQNHRGEILRELGYRKNLAFREKQIHQVLSVLTLGKVHNHSATEAISSNYIKVDLLGSISGPNQMMNVKITGLSKDGVNGTIVKTE
jgi:threonylcarbamoyladenosine tRNA methylthiotransferase MtaB